MMSLADELAPDVFDALLEEYQRLLKEVFAEIGGREIEVDSDTVIAAFPTAKQAALAAVAAHRAVAAQEWPHGRRLAMSVGLDSGEAGTGWDGPAALRCAELCDAAEGGQIFLTQTVGGLLEEENLDELSVRDLGEVPLRRSERKVRAFELVVAF
jgi:class 3 adenylate cyclase